MEKDTKSIFNIGNLYVIMWLIYSYLALTNTEIGPLRVVALLLSLITSLYCYARLIHKRLTNEYLKALHWLFCMFMFYGVILVASYSKLYVSFQYQAQPTFWFIEEMVKSILPIFAFYYFSKKGYYAKLTLQIWFVVFVLFSIYIFSIHTTVEQFALIYAGEENKVNNMCYLSVALLPGIALFESKRIIQMFILMLVVGISLTGMKRGAILVSASSLIWYIFLNLKKSSMTTKLFTILLATVVLSFVLQFFDYMLANNAFFSNRFDATLSGSTGNRDVISEHLWEYYLTKANIFQMLFGSGAYATIRIGVNFAHNDWLEILICEGIWGLALYIYYWYVAIKTTYQIRYQREIFLALSLFFIIYLGRTFFSMSINDMSFMSTLFLGYYLSKWDDERGVNSSFLKKAHLIVSKNV